MEHPTETGSCPWNVTFLELFDKCCAEYKSGNEDFETYYDEDSRAFLSAIGHKPREFFDFVEDFCDGYDVAPSTALLVAAVRHDYFLTVQKGVVSSEKEILPADLPAKNAEYDGIVWLPRILVKARGKLAGTLDPNIMYSCGGDRAFLARHDLHAADFLRVVWAAGDNDARVAAYVTTGRWA
ncbi:MAG: hypothetical protein KDN22_03360 [Verrucomicrobiae bacterium]|nr:hypothetical protein [Verrucomicrobiae bacterium]